MIKNKKIMLIPILFFIIAVAFLLQSYKGDEFQETDKKSMILEDFIQLYQEGKSEFEYSDYVKIEMKESELLFDKTTPEGIKDDNFCNLMYDVKIKNITNEDIKIFVKFFIPKQLYETIVLSRDSFGLEVDSVQVDPGKRLLSSAGIIMKHYKKLTTKELELFNE